MTPAATRRSATSWARRRGGDDADRDAALGGTSSGRSSRWRTGDAADLGADLRGVGVDQRGDREAPLAEPAVVGEGLAEVAGADDDDRPVVGEAELAAHLEQEVLDVVADEYLLFQMSRELGLTHDWPVVIVGAGNLGQPSPTTAGSASGAFPSPRSWTSTRRRSAPRSAAHKVRHLDDLPEIVGAKRGNASASSPPRRGAAQEAADRLVAAGVTSILNFAPASSPCREGSSLRKVDLAVELQILSFYQQRRACVATSTDREC